MGPNTELVHSLEPVHWVGMETLPDELFLRLSRQLGTEGGDRVTHADGGEGFRAGVEFDEPQSRRSQRRSAEMESLRAEALELEGDLDVRTMEWLRERQDAETQLLTYRDRARELKPRLQALRIRGPDLPCPTCGVTLGDRYPEVLSALEEEWERLVQDGRWWKRRREQLEWKPPDLRTMETKALELQAEIRSGAQTSPESDSGHENRGAVQEEDGSSHEMGALLLAQAEEFLSRLTAGRLGGLQRRKERLEVVEGGSTFGPVDSEDHVVLLLSLELAFHELSRGPVDRVLILAGLLDLLPEETCRRALHLLNQTHGHAGQLLVVSNGSVPERFPADFRLIAEVLPHPGEGRPAFRQLSWGPAGVVL